ncbi:MAG TPA: hypothetical protein GXZ60_11850 [Intrasporangiaceae bacterium]|nr:hypothetical protein [Intrasporangiaceae bacterium]
MTVNEGHFRLYPSMRPHLTAGTWKFTTTQSLDATESSGAERPASQHPVEALETHVEVTSPRYQLPPDQILSTWPPAGAEGDFGSRLPQIVIKRRTLPWERDVVPGTKGTTPWLALVVIAEGEADLVLNAPVADCVTTGVTLPGAPDVSTGNYLRIRRSVIHDILPTAKDVPLLAHVREVDISDTEMMMGDDDGFVAVVVANRLPLPGRAADGTAAPMKYLAALISLEGQLPSLLPTAPEPTLTTIQVPKRLFNKVPPAHYDQILMTGHSGITQQPAGPGPRKTASGGSAYSLAIAPESTHLAYAGGTSWPLESAVDSTGRDQLMAADFIHVDLVSDALTNAFDPVHHYPVLVHWSFTSAGDATFERLLRSLDSGLLGTTPPVVEGGPEEPSGRRPLVVAESGHVELPHRTRHGDLTTAWYRGPLSPHPTDVTAQRLPLAHTADQVRIVVPDGREDLSLATAFEIGRLLALSHPSIVDALLRWRQNGFQLARGQALGQASDFALDEGFSGILRDLSEHLARKLIPQIVKRPGDLLGDPLDLHPLGTSMLLHEQLSLDGSLPDLIARGLAVDADLAAPATTILPAVMDLPVQQRLDLDPRTAGALTSQALTETLDLTTSSFAAGTLGLEVSRDWRGGTLEWDRLDLDLYLDTIGPRPGPRPPLDPGLPSDPGLPYDPTLPVGPGLPSYPTLPDVVDIDPAIIIDTPTLPVDPGLPTLPTLPGTPTAPVDGPMLPEPGIGDPSTGPGPGLITYPMAQARRAARPWDAIDELLRRDPTDDMDPDEREDT